MHPLGRLIAQRMDHPDNRWSVRDVERQARAQRQSLNRSHVSALRKKMTPSITKKNVFGLAAGLGVTPLTVALAALESWDIETRPVEVTDSLVTIAIDPSLSDANRRQLRALVTAMRSDRSPAAESDDVVRDALAAPFDDALKDEDDGTELGGSPGGRGDGVARGDDPIAEGI